MFFFSLQSTTQIPESLSYSLHFPGNITECSASDEACMWYTDHVFPKNIFTIRAFAFYDAHPAYHVVGFLKIQNAIFKAFTKIHRPSSSVPDIQLQQLPYPPHADRRLIVYLPFLIPIIFLVSFNYAFINSVRYISVEKEKQLKEAMQIMGLASWMHHFCWFIRTMTMLLIPILMITIVLKVFCFFAIDLFGS